ncbi:hypothetical protein FHL15_004778 [Xylaria flabelliformis]|uniref:EngB-type G domain-containing protein n=1 Tax=Xylaria flabelliformis TaxID=2512241 RepID=A0A553I284_9PEZI|nr:hypothetical protein FHL15_004778 [Xylaria flabelliformis]
MLSELPRANRSVRRTWIDDFVEGHGGLLVKTRDFEGPKCIRDSVTCMMMPATSLPLKALLAMPTALRPILLGAFAPTSSRPRWSQNRCFSASTFRYAAAKYPKVAALLIPEFRTSAITEITPDDLFKTSSLASAPGQPLEDELTKLYIRNPAAFVYAESDFYKLRKNTRVPEVCILGRSNVGKSSFVNALANRSSNGLAHVSTKAGKTRSINTYGFGPAPTIKELQDQGSKRKDEDIPTHTFHLVDMPGYGHASLKEWGKNIALYLKKRNFVKGAIVLIDAEVGPKDSDFHLLQLLSEAQLKTAIVMTKADKVRKGLEGLRETCTKVWDGIRAIEAQSTDGNWVWEKDVYVTAVGAKDSAVARSTLTTARLAVARLAGLIKDDRLNVERNKRWSGKMISFDDLQYASGKSSISETKLGAVKSSGTGQDTPSSSGTAPDVSKGNSAFAELEQATKAQHSSPIITRPRPRLRSRRGRTPVRAFHSTPIRNNERMSDKPTPDELKLIIDDFLKTLKADTPRDKLRRLWQEREECPTFFKASPRKIRDRQVWRLQQRFPEQTSRTRAVYNKRLQIEERRHWSASNWDNETKAALKNEWPVIEETSIHNNVNGAIDVTEFEAMFNASGGLAGRQGPAKKN